MCGTTARASARSRACLARPRIASVPSPDWARNNSSGVNALLTGGGIWIPLRGDAAVGVGTAPVTANPANYGGSSHGTYTHRAGGVKLIFVLESGLVANVLRCAFIPIQRDYT